MVVNFCNDSTLTVEQGILNQKKHKVFYDLYAIYPNLNHDFSKSFQVEITPADFYTMTENEARGFDFRPDGGESPRDVLVRVQSWIDEVAKAADDVVAVTHLGVIRVVMAAAHNWDMLGKPPVKIRPATAHLFDIDPGTIRVRQMNIPLQANE